MGRKAKRADRPAPPNRLRNGLSRAGRVRVSIRPVSSTRSRHVPSRDARRTTPATVRAAAGRRPRDGRRPRPRPGSRSRRDSRRAGRSGLHRVAGGAVDAPAGRAVARAVAGSAVQWRRPYAEPQPREAVAAASVWVLGYPGSVITRPGESVIATWADPELWDAFEEIGIDLLHTGPVKRSGGIRGREYTPTIDGWFDRISPGDRPGARHRGRVPPDGRASRPSTAA